MKFSSLEMTKNDLIGEEGEIMLTLTVYTTDLFVMEEKDSGKTEFTQEEIDEMREYMNHPDHQYVIRIVLTYKIEDGKVTFS